VTLTRQSPCKINLLLNILGRRPDGFHELETVMQPVPVHDELTFERRQHGIDLTCSDPSLPSGPANLVYRAAEAFFRETGIDSGARIHLEKRIPVAAGLGGGSGNAGATLLALNELFGLPLSLDRMQVMAASLGSDIPFFLQSSPAVAIGRGERVEPRPAFRALAGCGLLLVHPGFGIATAWAYKELGRFSSALNGTPGAARELVALLDAGDLRAASRRFYNSLEAPALEKYPWLAVLQDFLREQGAEAALMSGSGSTTFAITAGLCGAQELEELVKTRFGRCWTASVSLAGN
jgi:4-diphosphocytidyl-2-C-methyl-D-erythritol kinase